MLKVQGFLDTGDDQLFTGDTPIMFDEWQLLPELFDSIRAEVDIRSEKGLFILTGSVSAVNSLVKHSGIGRVKRILMRPFSLYESCDSLGTVSLNDLFTNSERNITGTSTHQYIDIANLICRGGWPDAVVLKDSKYSLKIAKDYFDNLLRYDVVKESEIKINPTRLAKILKSYSRFISSSTSIRKIEEDIKYKIPKICPIYI